MKRIIMKIAITGGKGGTGKSTVATALAVELAKDKKVLLMDADTDCPNDHLILSIERKKEQDIMQLMPRWDNSKCIKCGRCAEVCKENAIVSVKDRYPIFVKDLCNGCGACILSCPVDAITKDKQIIGTIYSGKGHGLDLVTAEMRIGYEEASPIVNALKKFSLKDEKQYDHIFIDTAAGSHCNVISALLGCEKAIAVTEPTPLGASDLKLILKLCKVLDIPASVVLNRADIGDKKLIQDIAKKYNAKIITEIPYKKEILEEYSRGEPIKHESINKIIDEIR
ncbi:P-loop NTPase [Candidatus Woesearchaeota archaeon]|nr:P-loop NTPase [Candidatus Woesearchaeota archaeon]